MNIQKDIGKSKCVDCMQLKQTLLYIGFAMTYEVILSFFLQTGQLTLSRISSETFNYVFPLKVGLFTSSSYVHAPAPN